MADPSYHIAPNPPEPRRGRGGKRAGAGRKPGPAVSKSPDGLHQTLMALQQTLALLLVALERISVPAPSRRRSRASDALPAAQTPPAPHLEAPPNIRTIKDIIAHDRVTPVEAKRIQEAELLARSEWRPLRKS